MISTTMMRTMMITTTKVATTMMMTTIIAQKVHYNPPLHLLHWGDISCILESAMEWWTMIIIMIKYKSSSWSLSSSFCPGKFCLHHMWDDCSCSCLHTFFTSISLNYNLSCQPHKKTGHLPIYGQWPYFFIYTHIWQYISAHIYLPVHPSLVSHPPPCSSDMVAFGTARANPPQRAGHHRHRHRSRHHRHCLCHRHRHHCPCNRHCSRHRHRPCSHRPESAFKSKESAVQRFEKIILTATSNLELSRGKIFLKTSHSILKFFFRLGQDHQLSQPRGINYVFF